MRQAILNCSSEIVTFKVRDCSLEEEAGCEESVDGVSGKVSQTKLDLLVVARPCLSLWKVFVSERKGESDNC